MENRMEALLTAIALWLSINFPLPANLNHPGIKIVSAAEMIAPLNKNQLRRSDVSASEISSDIVSLYSNESKTIFLLDDGQARHLLSYPFLCGCAGSACWSRRPPKIRNHRPATLPSCRVSGNWDGT